MDQIDAPRLRSKTNISPVISLTVEVDGQLRKIRGREAWTLWELISRGRLGVTPIERPAPRWAHYVHKLRRACISIETVDEKHGGAFSGTHARYVLRSALHVVVVIRQNDLKFKRRDGAQGFATLPMPEGVW